MKPPSFLGPKKQREVNEATRTRKTARDPGRLELSFGQRVGSWNCLSSKEYNILEKNEKLEASGRGAE